MVEGLNISPSLEDYLEAVLAVENLSGGARTTDIAAKLGVSKASVNQAMGILAERDLITRERYGPVYLTDAGRRQAIVVQRRHRSIKEFLWRILGVDEATAEEDACRIEHVVSSQTMQKLLDFLDKEVQKKI